MFFNCPTITEGRIALAERFMGSGYLTEIVPGAWGDISIECFGDEANMRKIVAKKRNDLMKTAGKYIPIWC